MDLRQLKYFAAVADAKSFTRAADQLRIAQPALSLQMRKLEEELGERLMVRHSRGIELTEPGTRLLTHARAILHQLAVAKEDVHETGDIPEALVRVGMPRSVSEIITVSLFKQARERFPQISLRLVEQFSEQIGRMLADRDLDLGLTFSHERSSRLIAEEILRERLFLASPADAPDGGDITFAEAARLPLILGSREQVVRSLLETLAGERRTELNVVYEINSIETTLNIVEGNLGHTIIPLAAATRAVQAGAVRIRSIVEPVITRPLYLVYPAAHISTRAQRAVVSLLLELSQAVAGGGARPPTA